MLDILSTYRDSVTLGPGGVSAGTFEISMTVSALAVL